MKKMAVVLGIVLMCLAGINANGSQWFSASQPTSGYSTGDWSYMSAWNLSSGSLEVSSAWYSGYLTFWYDASVSREWTALFVYDQGTGLTIELTWAYWQPYYGH